MTLTVKFGRWKDNLRKLPPISYPLFKELNCFILPEGNCRDRNLANFATFFSVSLFSDLLRHLTFLKKSFFSLIFSYNVWQQPHFHFLSHTFVYILRIFWSFGNKLQIFVTSFYSIKSIIRRIFVS